MRIIITIEVPDAELEEKLKAEGVTREEFIKEIGASSLLDADDLITGATATIAVEDLVYNHNIHHP